MIRTSVWRWLRAALNVTWVMAAVMIGGFSSKTTAANLTVAWDNSPDPTVAGYNIYFGSASGNYTNLIDAGGNLSVSISNLVSGITYYFAATTYSLSGAESDYSSEISYSTPPSTPSPTLAASCSGTNRTVTVFGNIGARCQLQSSTNLALPAAWVGLLNCTLTNTAQIFPVDSKQSVIFYRLLLQ